MKIFVNTLVLIEFLIFSCCMGLNYPNSPDSDPPSQWSSMSSTFVQHCSPFGISVFALSTDKVTRDQFLHACNVLAQFIDNDQDGCADDINVVKMMRLNQAGMAIMDVENDAYVTSFARGFEGEKLYTPKINLSCSGSSETSNCYDETLEKAFDMISEYGISPYYYREYGACYDGNFAQRSEIQQQMDIARGGHFTTVPATYPAGAVFHKYEATCTYQCQVTDFFYYALSSLLEGQDARVSSNMYVWEASTPLDLQTKLPDMYSLLTRTITSMKVLSSSGVLPGTGGSGATATYNPSSQTCSNGCGLDGSGCGVLGNRDSVNECLNTGTTFAPSSTTTSSPVQSPQQSPTASPTKSTSSCSDSVLLMKLNQTKERTCAWVASQNTSTRCSRSNVRDHCPSTCNGNCSADSTARFEINSKFRTCKWVARKRTAKRCTITGVKDTCRKTCSASA